jgi:hypothetical protein
MEKGYLIDTNYHKFRKASESINKLVKLVSALE